MCELNSRMNRTRFPKQTNLRQISAYPVAGDGGFLRKFDRPKPDQGHPRTWSFEIRPRRNRRPGAAITSPTRCRPPAQSSRNLLGDKNALARSLWLKLKRGALWVVAGAGFEPATFGL